MHQKGLRMKAVEEAVVDHDDEAENVDDLDAWLEEVTEEDTVEPYSFTFRGQRWVLAKPDEFDWQEYSRVSSAPADSQDARPTVHMLMGDEQYERFCELKQVPAKAIDRILERWRAHHGVDAPESRASRRASARTARPSKPTSRRRTK